MAKTTLNVAIAQLAPVWLQRDRTIEKLIHAVEEAAKQGAEFVAFGEAIAPGYPFWVEHTDGARFESSLQKALYAHYHEQAVCIERGDLASICAVAKAKSIAVALGIIESPRSRGHSCYASAVYINAHGEIQSVHRKLMPTFEERLVWATGDGHGLCTHDCGPFTVGLLNCWENWMPLARAALYAQGENFHVAIWPGNVRNTEDLTRHMAREGRSYAMSVSGLMERSHIDSALPFADELRAAMPEVMANGGSCIAGPDGQWVIEPIRAQETVVTAEIDLRKVFAERQNFDPCGHYSRPDVLQLRVNRERQQTLMDS